MKVSLIWAMSSNRCIGVNNQLPWHLPEDLAYFKRTTMHKPIIMGRKTYESIGRPLPGRANIVISRDANLQIAGTQVVNSIEQALQLAALECQKSSAQTEEVMIIGGAQIYAASLALADQLYVTEVDAEIDGDAFFPEFATEDFAQIACEEHLACDKNPYNYRFKLLQRLIK